MNTQALVAWLATYFLHSTVLLAAAWLVTRGLREARAREGLWRAALFGALLTTLVQVQLAPRWTRPRPAGTPVASSSLEPSPALFGLLSVAQRSSSARVLPAPAVDLSKGIAAVWGLVGCLLLARGIARRRRFLERLRGRRPLSSQELALVRAGGSGGSPRLTASSALNSPVLLSRTEVCLPERALAELPAAQLRSMLAHEWAHIVRGDTRWLALYRLIEAFFFFQPLVFVATRALRADAELACDRQAVARGADAVVLAGSLATVAEWGAPHAGALGVLGGKESVLLTRVRALLDGERVSPARRRLAAGVLIALGLGLACGGPAVEGRPEASVGGEPDESSAGVLRCQLVSDVELLAAGESYALPGDWPRFGEQLERLAVDARAEDPSSDSSLRVEIRARDEVEFGKVLRVMESCARARVWDITIVTPEGVALAVPLPNDLEVIAEEVEEEAEESRDEVAESVHTAKVSLRRRSGELTYALDGEFFSDPAALGEALRERHREAAVELIVLDAGGVLSAGINEMLRETFARIAGVRVVFVGSRL